MLMGCNVLHANLGQIINRRTKANRFSNGRRPRLKLMWKGIRAEGTQFHFLDHVTAAEKGRHGFE